MYKRQVETPYRFKSGHQHHVGASCISLAPTFFKSQSVLIPLLLLFRKRSRSRRLFACKRAHDGFGSLPTFCGDAGQLHLFRSTLPVRVSIWTLGFLFLQFRYEHRYHVAANPYDKVWYTHGCPEFSCWNMHGTYLCMLGTNVCAIDF